MSDYHHNQATKSACTMVYLIAEDAIATTERAPILNPFIFILKRFTGIIVLCM